MQNLRTLFQKWKKLAPLGYLAFFCINSLPVAAQIQSVTAVQNLSFGAFTTGTTGGTVTVNNLGERTSSGSVILLNLGQAYYQALFDVTAPEGTIISILNGPDAILRGSNGGSVNLHIGASEPTAPFVSGAGGTTRIGVGGTLTVHDAATSPPGSYTGTFYITFNNE